MNKYEILKGKLEIINSYIDKMDIEDGSTNNYLQNYRNYIEKLIIAIDKKTMRSSNGALLGLIRGISDYDELCSDEQLWNMVMDADNYYSNECKEW